MRWRRKSEQLSVDPFSILRLFTDWNWFNYGNQWMGDLKFQCWIEGSPSFLDNTSVERRPNAILCAIEKDSRYDEENGRIMNEWIDRLPISINCLFLVCFSTLVLCSVIKLLNNLMIVWLKIEHKKTIVSFHFFVCFFLLYAHCCLIGESKLNRSGRESSNHRSSSLQMMSVHRETWWWFEGTRLSPDSTCQSRLALFHRN